MLECGVQRCPPRRSAGLRVIILSFKRPVYNCLYEVGWVFSQLPVEFSWICTKRYTTSTYDLHAKCALHISPHTQTHVLYACSKFWTETYSSYLLYVASPGWNSQYYIQNVRTHVARGSTVPISWAEYWTHCCSIFNFRSSVDCFRGGEATDHIVDTREGV
jgi:hypothetical protein